MAFGAFGDRFDHELASISALFKWQLQRRAFDRLLLMGERMTATLLEPGRHTIFPNPDIEGPTCGLLPIGGRVERASTSGLRWNLDGQVSVAGPPSSVARPPAGLPAFQSPAPTVAQPLEFGALVSSSNEIVTDRLRPMQVTIETSHPVVWTTVLRPDGWARAADRNLKAMLEELPPPADPGRGRGGVPRGAEGGERAV